MFYAQVPVSLSLAVFVIIKKRQLTPAREVLRHAHVTSMYKAVY